MFWCMVFSYPPVICFFRGRGGGYQQIVKSYLISYNVIIGCSFLKSFNDIICNYCIQLKHLSERMFDNKKKLRIKRFNFKRIFLKYCHDKNEMTAIFIYVFIMTVWTYAFDLYQCSKNITRACLHIYHGDICIIILHIHVIRFDNEILIGELNFNEFQ